MHDGDFGDESSRADGPLAWDDVGFLLNSIAGASRQWRVATQRIRDEFALKPRGPWILGQQRTERPVQCCGPIVTADRRRDFEPQRHRGRDPVACLRRNHFQPPATNAVAYATRAARIGGRKSSAWGRPARIQVPMMYPDSRSARG